MGSLLLRPDMEAVLEWILLIASGAFGLCILALGTMLIVGRYRLHRKRKDSGTFKPAL
jgi:hypothetical protein